MSMVNKNKFMHIELLIRFKIYEYLIWYGKCVSGIIFFERYVYASSQNITKPKGDTKNRLTTIEEAEP